MSGLVKSAETPLPNEAEDEKPHLVREYISLLHGLILGKVVLKLADWVGLVLLVPLAASTPVLVLALSPNPLVLAATAQHLSWWAFFGLALARLLIADPIHYLIGRQSATFLTSHQPDEVREHFRWVFETLRRLTKKLEQADRRTLLGAIFVFTLVPIPVFNIYYVAGAARVRAWKVALLDVAATTLLLIIFYLVGSQFDLIDTIQRLALDTARLIS